MFDLIFGIVILGYGAYEFFVGKHTDWWMLSIGAALTARGLYVLRKRGNPI